MKKDYTIVIVTHNMQQAARVSDKTAFFLNGEIIEYDDTDKIFSTPKDQTNRRLYNRTIRIIYGGVTLMNIRRTLTITCRIAITK